MRKYGLCALLYEGGRRGFVLKTANTYFRVRALRSHHRVQVGVEFTQALPAA